jgi:hypothetical protein
VTTLDGWPALLARPGRDERLLELGVRLEERLGAGTRAESVL